MAGLIGKLFLLQLFIAICILLILRWRLERELVKHALERLEALSSEAGAKEAIILSARPLERDLRDKMENIFKVKFPGSRVVFLENKELRGGVVVRFGGTTIDQSLLTRLKEVFGAS